MLQNLEKIHNPGLRPIAEFAIETAMRSREILGMRWEQVDLKKRLVYLPVTKNGEVRTVPLSDRAIGILEALPRSLDGRVFATRKCRQERLRRRVQRSGIQNSRFHDLRREATSRLFERGFSLVEVSAITSDTKGKPA